MHVVRLVSIVGAMLLDPMHIAWLRCLFLTTVIDGANSMILRIALRSSLFAPASASVARATAIRWECSGACKVASHQHAPCVCCV